MGPPQEGFVSPRRPNRRSRTRSAICCSQSSISRANANSMPKALCKPLPTSLSRDSIASRTSCKRKANGLEMPIWLSWMRFGTGLKRNDEIRMTKKTRIAKMEMKRAQWRNLSSLPGVCFCFLIGHILRPDEPFHQFASGDLRVGGVAHGACYPDATSKERRSGGGIWRGCDGKHFRRAND